MRFPTRLCQLAIMLSLAAAGCAPVASPPPATETATEPLRVNVLYPTANDTRHMGQSIKSIIQVLDAQGQGVNDAQVSVSIFDPSGELAGQLSAAFGHGDVYRSESWTVPHRVQAGNWTVQVQAGRGSAQGKASVAFRVKNSVSEDLLEKYGFWVDAPTLKDITPDLFKEQGDAQNGVIVWGGLLPRQHIYVENWLEVQWRQGRFDLSSAERVRSFMFNDLGDFGFYPIRAVGPFERVKFKGWEAWQVKGRGEFSRYDQQWMIFYSPEADKTYVLGTMVVLPPAGIDPHATLRDGFEVHPELHASGVAPIPLARLLGPPQLSAPELGTRFMSSQPPIVLSWQPLKALAPDEYYQVKVDYNYSESNTALEYWTRDTQLTLPAELYDVPNCGVFNWRVTLMKKNGTDADGQPRGTPLSYASLYWYVEWLHPAGAPAPFQPRCPNPQT